MMRLLPSRTHSNERELINGKMMEEWKKLPNELYMIMPYVEKLVAAVKTRNKVQDMNHYDINAARQVAETNWNAYYNKL